MPALALVLIAGLKVQQSVQEMADTREEVRLVEAAMGPNGLTTGLHDERTTASLTPIGMQTAIEIPFTENADARRPTDAALGQFHAALEDSPRAAEIYGPALDALGGLSELRSTIDNDPGPFTLTNVDAADVAFNGYSALLDNILDANRAIALEIEDPVLRRGAQLSDLATRQMDAISHLARPLLLQGTSGPMTDKDDFIEAGGNLTAYREGHEQLLQLARGPYAEFGQRLADDVEEINLAGRVGGYLEAGQVNVGDLINAISYRPESSYLGFRNSVEEIIQRRTDEMESDAATQFRLYLTIAITTVLLAAAVTWLVSRSITRPLRALTQQATEMAERRLPEAVLQILNTPLGEDVSVPRIQPIRVKTRDEVADVAEALNTVQDSALDLAVEQAVLRRNIADSFVNLGRRNQNLLGRQLDFITELEHNETDPDTLGNLFRLDHLATRMRRNAESLLVLAGIDPPRKWAAPVRVTDVIRAALSEVEDYQRVTVRAVEPATVVGAAAADLAHLLAELTENALIFSPPDQMVEVRGRTQPAGYTLAIIDSGLGMPPEELARANRRLAGAESFTIAPSKYLGHYVAGNLAARHNISVQLHNSPGHGITATINLPPALLTGEEASSLGQDPGVASETPMRSAPAVTGPMPATPAPPATAAPAATGAMATPPPPPPPTYATPTAPTSRTAPAQLTPPNIQAAQPPAQPPRSPGQAPGRPTGPPPAHGHTASGLARRTPVTSRADASRHDHLLQALANYTGRYSQPGTGGTPAATVPPGEESGWPAPAPYPRPPVHSGQTPVVPSPPLRPAGVPNGASTFVVPTGVGATSSGLTRRVRGAQMPTTEPPSLRRHQSPSRVTGQQSAAKDVYSFLTDFTAGVKRGLAEAEGTGEMPREGAEAASGSARTSGEHPVT